MRQTVDVFRFDLANTGSGADLDVLLDGERLDLITVKSGARAVDVDGNELPDRHEIRATITAGPHELGAAFLYTPAILSEANRKPFANPTICR